MEWDVNLIRPALEAMVNRALQNTGEPPFPFLREVRIWEEPRDLRHGIELRFTNDTAVCGQFNHRVHEERRRFCVQDRVDFHAIERIAQELYVHRVRDRIIDFRVRQANARGDINSPTAWLAYREDGHREAERWTQAAYSYRDQRRAMSVSLGAQRRPPQQPFDNTNWDPVRRYWRQETVQFELDNLLRDYPDLRYNVPDRRPSTIMGAHQKGRELLWNNLTVAQQISLKARGYFEVIGNRSGHTYRIYHGTQQNVMKMPGPMPGVRPTGGPFSWLNPFRLEETPMLLSSYEKRIYGWKNPRGLCFIYSGLVHGDVMLGQKLSIETEEDAVAKVAISFPVDADFWQDDHYGPIRAREYWAVMPCAPAATAMGA